MDRYKCEMCLGTFIDGTPWEDVLKEGIQNGFGEYDPSQHARVCDDCFKTIQKKFNETWEKHCNMFNLPQNIN